MNRSTFLKYSSLPLLSWFLNKCSLIESKPFLQREVNRSPVVIIIGSGISGLAAALKLKEFGISSQIIEAQDRVGGRIHSVLNENSVSAELGAQLFNKDMKQLIHLLESNGLNYSSAYKSGKSFILTKSGRERWEEEEDLYDWIEPEKFDRIINSLKADEDISLSKAMGELVDNKQKKEILKNLLRELLGKNPDNVSAKSTYDIFYRYKSELDADGLHSESGLQRLVDSIARQVEHKPLLANPAFQIQEKNGKFLTKTKTSTFESQYVILAVPPPIIRKIKFEPKLPNKIQEALTSFIPGDMIKLTLIFKEPFWRKENWNGSFISKLHPGVTVIDSSLENSKAGKLVVFIGSETARKLVQFNKSKREIFAKDLIKQAFGENSLPILEYYEGIWVDHPWSGGGYNSIVRFGGLHNAAEILRNWNSKIIFAGSELAESFPGYMEGGIRSGYRAANKITI